MTCFTVGGIAPESGWEQMLAELSTDRNGPADYMVKAGELFDLAKYEGTEQDIINYIAKGGELSLDKFTFVTPMTPATLASQATARWISTTPIHGIRD